MRETGEDFREMDMDKTKEEKIKYFYK